MGGRYYITGTQLGMLSAFLMTERIGEAQEFLKKIETDQYIGEVD